MPLGAELISHRFQQAMRALTEAAPVSVERTLRAEAGSILKACAGRTKVAKADAITLNERLRIVKDLGYNGGNRGSDIHINVGIRGAYGKIWRRTRPADGGGWVFQQTHAEGFRPLNRHYGDKVWTDLREAVDDFRYEAAKRIPLARRSAGLARQSWVQIADSLGIILELVPGGNLSGAGLAKARAALTSQGRAVTNGFSEEQRGAQGFFMKLINRLPYGPAAGLDGVLAGVLAGRAAYFEQNMARGVFRDQAKILRAYPGLTIHHGAN